METRNLLRARGQFWRRGTATADVHPALEPDRRRRVRCCQVARRRARRYARRHRIIKLLWPLIAMAVLVELVFARLPGFGKRPAAPFPVPGPDAGTAATTVPEITDFLVEDNCAEEWPASVYRPPETFLARDVAQLVAFLIRNRGQVDNDAVRAKWAMLDEASLPLAVYLREIEASDGWNDLTREMRAIPPTSARVTATGKELSLHWRRLIGSLPEWTMRGEELISRAMDQDLDETVVDDLDDRPDPGTVTPK